MSPAHAVVIAALHEALDAVPELCVRKADLPPSRHGHIHYPSNTITIARHADLPLFSSALMHELVHLRRGPGFVDEVAWEEARVLRETALLLAPPDSFPSTTSAEHLANHLGIDTSVARLALQLARRRRVA